MKHIILRIFCFSALFSACAPQENPRNVTSIIPESFKSRYNVDLSTVYIKNTKVNINILNHGKIEEI